MAQRITLAQGAGGEAMRQLIDGWLSNLFDVSRGEVSLAAMDDSAIIDGIVFTTDSYTVDPLFFPGGDVGVLAVSGTINDLVVMGAQPLALASAMVLEEGFPLSDLDRIIHSMGETARRAKTPIVTGDTKVVERGGVRGCVITTSGIGKRSPYLDGNIREVRRARSFKNRWLTDSCLREGDVILVSGTVGDHGVALLSFREGYGFESTVQSDVAPLGGIIDKALQVGGIVAMKDPTRGGLANTLNEFAQKSGVGMEIDEESIPIRDDVRAACEMLGLDPLEIGNEGKVVLGVVPPKAEEVLCALHKTDEGKNAAIIGRATKGNRVLMRTSVGGERVIETPVRDPVPRIC